MSTEHRFLEYGSKNLSLDVTLDRGTASIRFGTRDPTWLHKRKERETTIIFKQAESVLLELVEQYGPITLRFDTASHNLKLWIQAQKDNFDFDEVTQDGEIGYRVTVVKKYTKYSKA